MDTRYIKRWQSCDCCGENRIFAHEFDRSRGKYRVCSICKDKMSNTKKRWRYCEVCGNYYQMSDFDVARGYKCPRCMGRHVPSVVWGILDKSDWYRVATHDFVTNKTKLHWICDKHGVYEATWHNMIYVKTGAIRGGCPMCCSGGRSATELEVEDYVVSLGYELGPRRGILPNKMEIDIYIPSIKIGIEVDGSPYHTEGTNDPFGRYIEYGSHKKKDAVAKTLGITMIHVDGDKWWLRQPNIKAKQWLKDMIENGVYVPSPYDTTLNPS